MQTYLAHVVPGLEELASEDLETYAGLKVERVVRAMDERSSILQFQFAGRAADLLSIRIVEDIFVVVVTAERLPIGWDGLAAIRAAVAGAPNLASALATFRTVRRTQRSRPAFRVITRKSGDHAFRRLDVQHAVESGLRDAGQGWMPGGEEAEVEVWAHLMDRTLLVGLRISDAEMRQRDYKEDSVPASLKPTVAHAMVLLSRPRLDDIVVDPMCGAGTLIIERAMAGRYRQLVAGDVDVNAVHATTRNVGPRYKPLTIFRWDARALPLADGSVTAVLTNMPFGKQVGSHHGNVTLYPRLLAEWARVVRPPGRLVLLTSERDLIERAVSEDRRLRISRRLSVVVRGLPATIYVLARVSG